MTVAELNQWLADRRAAEQEQCSCGHKRESHQDRCAGCNHSKCMCASFRKVEAV